MPSGALWPHPFAAKERMRSQAFGLADYKKNKIVPMSDCLKRVDETGSDNSLRGEIHLNSVICNCVWSLNGLVRLLWPNIGVVIGKSQAEANVKWCMRNILE